MTDHAEPNTGPMTQAELNEASRIVVIHLQNALTEIHAKDLHPAAALQAGTQMCLRAYADLLGDDHEAIRQFRNFLNQWEVDLDAPDEFSTH